MGASGYFSTLPREFQKHQYPYLTNTVTENGAPWMKQVTGLATYLMKVHLPRLAGTLRNLPKTLLLLIIPSLCHPDQRQLPLCEFFSCLPKSCPALTFNTRNKFTTGTQEPTGAEHLLCAQHGARLCPLQDSVCTFSQEEPIGIGRIISP